MRNMEKAFRAVDGCYNALDRVVEAFRKLREAGGAEAYDGVDATEYVQSLRHGKPAPAPMVDAGKCRSECTRFETPACPFIALPLGDICCATFTPKPAQEKPAPKLEAGCEVRSRLLCPDETRTVLFVNGDIVLTKTVSLGVCNMIHKTNLTVTKAAVPEVGDVVMHDINGRCIIWNTIIGPEGMVMAGGTNSPNYKIHRKDFTIVLKKPEAK